MLIFNPCLKNKKMIVRKTFWFILIGFSLCIAGIILRGSDIFFRLANFCIIFIIICLLLAFLSINGIAVKRHNRGFRQPLGQLFEEQFEVKNCSRFPRLWLKIEDFSNLAGKGGSRVLSWIGHKSERRYSSYQFLCKRGVFSLSPTCISSGDPFGVFGFSRTIENSNRLLVLPFLVELNQFFSPCGLLPLGKSHYKNWQMVPPKTSGIREYGPRDPLNHIHWPTTARRDRLMVKEFEQDPQADIWLFLDSQKEIHNDYHVSDYLPTQQIFQGSLWWLKRPKFQLPHSSYEYAISIAASLAKYFTRNGQVVGFVSDGQKLTNLPAERGERQLLKILETLSFMKCEGKIPLGGVIRAQAARLHKGSTAVIITTTETIHIHSAIDELIKRNIHPIMVLIDIYSFSGMIKTSDMMGKIQGYQIPYVVVKNGDDLKTVLETSGNH